MLFLPNNSFFPHNLICQQIVVILYNDFLTSAKELQSINNYKMRILYNKK